MPALSESARRRRTGTRLMLGFYVGWIVVVLATQFYQGAIVYGYGTGFGDGGHVPAVVAESAGFKATDHPTPAEVVKATTLTGPGGDWKIETVRLLGSLAVLIGIVLFWHAVMSRIGIF